MKRLIFVASVAAVLLSCGKDNGPTNNQTPPCNASATSVCTVVGTGEAGYTTGTALESKLYLPMDALFGPDGRLYVDDWNNHRIRAAKLPDGELVDVVGSGELGDGSGEPALETNLNHPTSFTFDANGNIIVAAWHNSKIKSLDVKSGVLTDISGTGARWYTGDEGPAAKAQLDLPSSVAFDKDGNLWFMDQANQVIRMIDSAGNIHHKAGQCITSGRDAPSACMPDETPVACPAPSDKFACESDANGCKGPPALYITCAGSFADGPAMQARMFQPVGQAAVPSGRIAFNKTTGDLYFADTFNNMIRKLTPDGNIARVAGTVTDNGKGGKHGYGGDGGPATSALLHHPVDVEIADDGTIYFTDTDNSCVRKIDTTGNISTVVGICGQQGFNGDGKKPTETLLNQPYGLTLHDGSLYVVDTWNHRVRQVVLP